MNRKLALLIGNSQYQDPKLAKLKAPDSDVSELAEILENPAIGGFDQVTTVLSELSSTVRVAIGEFFDDKQKDDLLLLYFSGHGLLDENGLFYLALKDTQYKHPRATGIPAAFIKDEMADCLSKRQVLILDCCNSGAFARGKGPISLHAIRRDTFENPGGYGQVVLTATNATQYAFEGDQVIGDVETSLFTHFLIDGLSTGQADSDRDGRITLDELYNYVYERVRAHTPHQTPRKWEQAREGEELVIARSRYRPTDLPSELRQAIESPYPNVREGAVNTLGQLLRGSDKSLARLAHGILKAMARGDDSVRVRYAALTVLNPYEETKAAKRTPRQDPTAPKPPIPAPEKTPPSQSISDPPKEVPAPIVSTPPRRNWFLWGGIGTGVLASIIVIVYAFGVFVPPSVIPTSTLTAPLTETLASPLAVTSLSTSTPPLFATDTLVSSTLGSMPAHTPIQPTLMLVSPTGTMVPTITLVPSNTPTKREKEQNCIRNIRDTIGA